MPTYKLNYFPFAGKAEPTRLLFVLGKIPFTDNKITQEQWSTIKPTTPFGQLPFLEVDGKVLAQASAIEHFVAKLAGLYPTDPWEAAKVDEAAECINEWLPLFVPVFGMKTDEEKTTYLKNTVEEKLKPKMVALTKMLERSTSGWLVGDKPTYADVVAFSYLSFVIGGMFAPAVTPDLLADFPALKAHHNKFASLPEVAAHYASATDRDTFKPL